MLKIFHSGLKRVANAIPAMPFDDRLAGTLSGLAESLGRTGIERSTTAFGVYYEIIGSESNEGPPRSGCDGAS